MIERQSTGSDSPGARLAHARQRLGLSLDQVSDKLRLEPQVVAALEADDHRAVGAAVFVRGFLRRYAELVKESPAEIDALYLRMPEAGAAPDLTSTGMHRLEPVAHHPKLGVVQALVAAAVLGVIAAVWWAMRAGPQPASDASVPQAQVLRIEAADATAGATPRALESTGETAPGVAVATGVAVTAGAAGSPAAGALAPGATLPGDPPLTPLQRHRLQVTFNGECWAEIYDGRGMRLFFGFGHAGSTQALSGVAPFRLVLGNVEAVAVAVDGASVALPAAKPGARLRVSLNGNGAVASVR